jgi:hypothetical protein
MRRFVAVAVLLLLIAGCTYHKHSAHQTDSTDKHGAGPGPTAPDARVDLAAPPESIAVSQGPFAAGPVRPPTTGALLGSWVRPESVTQPQRVAAVDDWEKAIGRTLDIVHTYKRLDEPFFTPSDLSFAEESTLMLSWAGGDSRSVAQGRHDALLTERARQVKAFGKPLLLRYRWEMDRSNIAATVWSPDDYIAAWRHVRAVFAGQGVHNVSWVWCPTVEGFERGDAPSYYPGDDAVDWICVDAYSGATFRPLSDQLRPFLQWSATHPTKPVMVGEFGVARVWGPAQRVAWLHHADSVFKANPQIKAVLYFESDPDGNPSNGQFRLSDDPPALAAFTALAREPYYNQVRHGP